MYSNEFFDVSKDGVVRDKHGNLWGHVSKMHHWLWSDGKDTEWYTGEELVRIGGLLVELDNSDTPALV